MRVEEAEEEAEDREGGERRKVTTHYRAQCYMRRERGTGKGESN